MTLPLLQLLKTGAPAPKVVFLPDGLFFTRAVPVSPGATVTEAAEQIALALETLSPFPPAQLYHGYYWLPGSEQALVFAAYRRRFTSDQVAAWEGADLVAPTFVALLGEGAPPATALLLTADEGLTALYWERGPVPSQVAFRPFAAEAGDGERAAVREELLRALPGTKRVIELSAVPVAEPSRQDREFVFRTGEHATRLAAAQAQTADVRDKAELVALRRSRARAVVLWRGMLGALAALLVLGLGELALVGGGFWQKTRLARVNAQRPVVEKIETAQNLTTRINELSTKRLLPFEMITQVSQHKPEAIVFLRTTTEGLYTLNVEAQSSSPSAVSDYQAKLSALPAYEKVVVHDQRTRDNVMTFTLSATFRPEALKPAATP